MPDWFYRTVSRPVLFRLSATRARDLALGFMGRLARAPGGAALIDFLGHTRPDPRLRSTLLGIEFPPGWYQNINAIGIIVLSPLFSVLWLKLGKRDPSHPVKFALGLLFVGLGFVVMARGAAASEAGAEVARVSGVFLVLTYVFHSIGEVCLSPVGLSAMTRRRARPISPICGRTNLGSTQASAAPTLTACRQPIFVR